MKYTSTAIALSLFLLLHAKAATNISAESIGRDYIIIGKLGIPLGTVTRISGEISYDTDSKSSNVQHPAFHITQINGTPLSKEIIIRYLDGSRPKIGKFEDKPVVESAIYEFSERQSLETTLKFAEQDAAANP